MHPIRILILAVLFYILYRILFGGKTKEAAKQAPPEIPTQDTLAEDPVCHTYVPRANPSPWRRTAQPIISAVRNVLIHSKNNSKGEVHEIFYRYRQH